MGSRVGGLSFINGSSNFDFSLSIDRHFLVGSDNLWSRVVHLVMRSSDVVLVIIVVLVVVSIVLNIQLLAVVVLELLEYDLLQRGGLWILFALDQRGKEEDGASEGLERNIFAL